MLEFVHLSGSEPGKDVQTRRKVRSQAMRDFRRRQRAEREGATQPSKSKSGVSKRATSKSQIRRRSASTELDVSAERTKKPTSLEPSPTRGPNPSEQGVQFKVPSSELPSIVVFDGNNLDSEGDMNDRSRKAARRTDLDRERWKPQNLVQNHSSVSTSSSTWDVEMEDPFESSAQLNQMSSFCKNYMHWLRPGIDSETAECVLSSAWEASQCPMLLAACCLASVGHLDAVQPHWPSTRSNYALYKARILQEVSERMQSYTSATSDDVIGTLACLLSFELSQGSCEALTHLRGLRSIIKMKGGMETLASTNLSSMLETLDLLHAAIHDAQPVLTSKEFAVPSGSGEEVDRKAFAEFIPLLLAEQEVTQRIKSPYSDMLQRLSEFLESVVHILSDTSTSNETESIHTVDNKTVIQLQELVERFGIEGLNEHNEAVDAHNVARACYCTLVVLYNLIVYRRPHRHRDNKKYADGLFIAIRRLGDEALQDTPYLQLLILLTGAVTSDDVTSTSFFKAQLIRLIYQMGTAEFRRIKGFLIKYLEMKQTLERTTRRATPPIELSKPTTTDAAYLYAGWPDSRRSSSLCSSATSAEGCLSYQSSSLSRNHSPIAYNIPDSVDLTAGPALNIYHDPAIESLLNYTGFERSGDFEKAYEQGEDTLDATRAFESASQIGNFWLTGVAG